MRRGVWCLGLLLATAASAQPVPLSQAKEKPAASPAFKASFFGEGGGYSHPDAGASDCLENCSSPKPGSDSPPDPAKTPAAKTPSRTPAAPWRAPLLRTGAPRQTSHEDAALKDSPREEPSRALGGTDRGKYSLWGGLTAPLELPPEKIKDVTPDQASGLVRRDYDTHILGRPSGAPVGNALPYADRDRSLALAGGEVFVALDLDLKPGGELKDAVADLARTVSFRQDPRFEPVGTGRSPQRVSVWGWMPAQRLGDASRAPAVARVEVQNGVPRRSPSAGTAGALSDILLGIRIPPRAEVGETFSRVTRELATSAGFRWRKTIGYQMVPGSPDLALVVEGEVPVKDLARVMAHPLVLKVAPAPPAVNAVPEADRDRSLPLAAGMLGRFLGYAAGRSPWLMVVTLLVLLPPVARGFTRLARVFIPYK